MRLELVVLLNVIWVEIYHSSKSSSSKRISGMRLHVLAGGVETP